MGVSQTPLKELRSSIIWRKEEDFDLLGHALSLSHTHRNEERIELFLEREEILKREIPEEKSSHKQTTF